MFQKWVKRGHAVWVRRFVDSPQRLGLQGFGPPPARPRPVVRFVMLVAAAMFFLSASAEPASAHARLVSTGPDNGAVLEAAPGAVELVFDEPVDTGVGYLRLYDERGDQVRVGDIRRSTASSSEISADLPGLSPGGYVATWRVLSADSHPLQGAFTFQVGAAAPAGGAMKELARRLLAAEGESASVGALLAVARALLLGALLVLAGAAGFFLLVDCDSATSTDGRRIVWVAWIAAVAGTIATLLLQGPYVAGLALADALRPSIVTGTLGTRYGAFALARLALLVAFAAVMGRRRPGKLWSRVRVRVLVEFAIALLATVSVVGHATTGRWVALALPLDLLHLGAAALWVGGLVLLFTVVLSSGAEGSRPTLDRFARVALVSVGVLWLTGVGQSWRQLDGFTDLWRTDYGRLLLLKATVTAAVVIVAGRSHEVLRKGRRRVTELATTPPGNRGGEPAAPDDLADIRGGLRQLVGLEMSGVVVAVALTALLVNAVPGAGGDVGSFSATLETPTVLVDVTVDPADTGPNVMHVYTLAPNGPVLDVPDLSASLSLPAKGITGIEVPMTKLAPGHYVSRSFVVPISGDWTLDLRVRTAEAREVTTAVSVPIDGPA